MAHLVYIGDEVSAAGWRLAGAQVHTPRAAEAASALRAALADAAGDPAALVLVSAATVAAVDPSLWQQAQCGLQPLVVAVPDPVDGVPAPDIAARLRRQLGMELR